MITIITVCLALVQDLIKERVPVKPIGQNKYIILSGQDRRTFERISDTIRDTAWKYRANVEVRIFYNSENEGEAPDVSLCTMTYKNGVCID